MKIPKGRPKNGLDGVPIRSSQNSVTGSQSTPKNTRKKSTPKKTPRKKTPRKQKVNPPPVHGNAPRRLTGNIRRRLSKFEQDPNDEPAAEVTAEVIEVSDKEPPQAQPKRVKLRVTPKKKRTLVMASQWKTKKPSRQVASSSEEGVQETVQEQAASQITMAASSVTVQVNPKRTRSGRVTRPTARARGED